MIKNVCFDNNKYLEEQIKEILGRVKNLIKDFKNNNQHKILLLEGIFLYHPNTLDDVWDKKIFLTGIMIKTKITHHPN